MPEVKSQIFPANSVGYIESSKGEFFISVKDLCHQLFLNPLATSQEIMEELGEKRVFEEVEK